MAPCSTIGLQQLREAGIKIITEIISEASISRSYDHLFCTMDYDYKQELIIYIYIPLYSRNVANIANAASVIHTYIHKST